VLPCHGIFLFGTYKTSQTTLGDGRFKKWLEITPGFEKLAFEIQFPMSNFGTDFWRGSDIWQFL
jgi:hypothetical protein